MNETNSEIGAKPKIAALSFLHAVGVVFYILLVALIMSNGEKIGGKMDKLFGPVAFLLLFTFSAAVTGSLVLGRPILWYLDGQKKEAVKLFIWVLGWMFLLTVIIFGIQIII